MSTAASQGKTLSKSTRMMWWKGSLIHLLGFAWRMQRRRCWRLKKACGPGCRSETAQNGAKQWRICIKLNGHWLTLLKLKHSQTHRGPRSQVYGLGLGLGFRIQSSVSPALKVSQLSEMRWLTKKLNLNLNLTQTTDWLFFWAWCWHLFFLSNNFACTAA